MNSGKLSSTRLRSHDYSKPGTYHLLIELMDDAPALGTECQGIVTPSASGEAFLAVLGQALQNFPCASLKAMDLQPRSVHMAVQLTAWRMQLCALPEQKRDWMLERRKMTISVFMGYLKMNSARRINQLRGVCNVSVWKRRFKDRVMDDDATIAALCTDLDAGFARLRLSKQIDGGGNAMVTLASEVSLAIGGTPPGHAATSSTEEVPRRGFDTMLLGRALFLTGSMLGSLPEEPEQAMGIGAGGRPGQGGRAPDALVCSIGPGRIFVTRLPGG